MTAPTWGWGETQLPWHHAHHHPLAHVPALSHLGAAGEEVLKEPGPQHLSLSMLVASLFQPAGGPSVILPTCSQGPRQALGQDLSQP